MLLMHYVTAYQATVVVDNYCTVDTLADAGYHTLWHTTVIIGIAKLIKQLLLLVVAHHALVGDGTPEVFMTVDIYHRWDGLDTHARKGLLHVAFEGLCLRMVDTVARRCLDEQVAVEHLLDAVDIAVVKRRTVLRVTLEVSERIAIVSV